MGSSSSSYAGGDQVDREPELGDLIEISRDNYKHWAVYVGAGFVVHFVNHSGVAIGASVRAANGIVLKEKMWNVVGKDKWKINNSMDRKYKPRPANAIVEDAKALVGKELRYDLVSFNCEHFVTELRYGVAESPQVEEAALGVLGGAGAIALAVCAAVAHRN
ncbi:phospholipase A and acyltransferase 3-like [Simochromis diagramma]|uniref:phospholipase A and acyltransferase 3-like n=1 Tax=Simochromis diagramma TaxID=43689 RepID=UPI001A7E81F1|nr:phospholipase A and acyltransferase 3-like [Simochromis diagramma]XP_039902775.1 phospholipase A and acyltransferase 3-like [Simochromis diagramma]